ncbi:MAG: MATE family efflux transporter [Salinivirgaceae bacterium]|nr:MATE family efflux transporter [Salinivirgaceae bacterium]
MKDLTKGNEFNIIFRFAVPMLIGNLFQQIYSIIDSIIVGQVIGKDALAAVGASFPISYTLIAFVIGIGSGGTIIISQYFGAKNILKVRQMIDTMLIFMFLSAIVVTAVGLIFSRDIFILLQLPPELIDSAVTYLNILFIGSITMFGFNATISILRGLGDSITPLYFLMLAAFLNIVLDLTFVLVFHWGIAGVAWATVLAQGIAFIANVLYLNKSNKVFKITLQIPTFNRNLFLKSVKIGLPTGFQQTFVALGMVAIMGIVNGFGTDVIAAYTAAGRIDTIASMPAMSLATALSMFVGQNAGANRFDRIRRGLISTIIMSGIVSITVSIAAWAFGAQLIGMFTSEPEVIRIGTQYLVIVSSFYILFSTMFSITGVMRGAGATLIPMFITLFSLWIIRIPIAYFLSDIFGSKGIWWAIPVAWLFGMIGTSIYYKTGKWRSAVVVTNKDRIEI